MRVRHRRIFVHDYMGGWLDRGIPLFTRNLAVGLQEGGWTVKSLRAWGMQRKWPRLINHILGALCEQCLSPILWRIMRADVAIFPYNAMPIVDVFSKRVHVVIHDTMAFQFYAPWYTRVYYRVIYFLMMRSGRPVFTVSEQEVSRLREFGFRKNTIKVLPNSFVLFRRLVEASRCRLDVREVKRNSVLLCTGPAPTKDLQRMLSELLPAVLDANWEVEVLGLGDYVARGLSEQEWVLRRATVLGRLSDQEVAEAYLRNRIIWVHSRQEGFGRCLVEGRLAGRPVVCSDIPEFKRLADSGVYLYKDVGQLLSLLEQAAMDCTLEVYQVYDDKTALMDALRFVARIAEIDGVVAD